MSRGEAGVPKPGLAMRHPVLRCASVGGLVTLGLFLEPSSPGFEEKPACGYYQFLYVRVESSNQVWVSQGIFQITPVWIIVTGDSVSLAVQWEVEPYTACFSDAL